MLYNINYNSTGQAMGYDESSSYSHYNHGSIRGKKSYTPDIAYPKDYHWAEDAACVGKNPDVFDLLEYQTSKSVGMTMNQVKMVNESNFRVAKAACDECPVFAQCEADATEDDFIHTFRAGRAPSNFNPRRQGRPRKGETAIPLEDKQCVNGHVGYYKRVSGNARCMKCVQIRVKVVTPAKPKIPLEEKTCKNGHVGQYVKRMESRKKGTFKHTCIQCERDRLKRHVAAKMGA